MYSNCMIFIYESASKFTGIAIYLGNPGLDGLVIASPVPDPEWAFAYRLRELRIGGQVVGYLTTTINVDEQKLNKRCSLAFLSPLDSRLGLRPFWGGMESGEGAPGLTLRGRGRSSKEKTPPERGQWPLEILSAVCIVDGPCRFPGG